MLVSEMQPRECYEFLARVGFGRLACVRENQPYIVPVYFAYEPHRLYGFATLGQKVDWMRSNPRVAVEADEVKSHIEWTSVVVQGRYEEFPDVPEYASIRQQAQSLLEKILVVADRSCGGSDARALQPRHPHFLLCSD